MYIKNTPNLIKSDFSDFTAFGGAIVTKNKTFPIEVFKGGRNLAINGNVPTRLGRMIVTEQGEDFVKLKLPSGATVEYINFNSIQNLNTGDEITLNFNIELLTQNISNYRVRYGLRNNVFPDTPILISSGVNYFVQGFNEIGENPSVRAQPILIFDGNPNEDLEFVISRRKVTLGFNDNEPYSPAPEDGYGYTGSDGAYHIQTSGGGHTLKFLATGVYLDNDVDVNVKGDYHSFNDNLVLWSNRTNISPKPIPSNSTYEYNEKGKTTAVGGVQYQFRAVNISDSLDFIASDPSIKEVSNVLEILKQSTLDKDVHTIHTSEGDFSAQVKMTTQGSLYASNAVMLEVEIRGDHRDLKREEITYTREIASEDVNSGTSETIDYGTFVVLEVDYDISSEKTTLVCYDLMVKTQQEYDSELFTYPTTVHNLLLSLASACNLELDTNTYKGSNLPITSDVWVNVNYTYRDILNHIAQLTTNTIKMQGDKLHLFDYEDTGVQLNRFANLKIGEDYGPTNILNISYEPQRDNVFSPANANDIPKDERKELVFVNNPIFMGNEQSYADTLLPQLTSMTYSTSEFKLYHGGIFQVGDMVEVFNGTEYVKTLITQQVLDSSNVQSEYISSVPFTFKSEYVVETDEKRQGQTTYFLVDKQNGIIKGLVEKQTETSEKISELELTTEEIQAQVSNIAVGSNIIYNLNFEDDMSGWRFLNDGYLTFGEKARFYSGVLFNSNAIPVETHSLSKSSIRFLRTGTALSPKGYVVPNSVYSYKARRMDNLQRYTVTVIEYNSSNTEIKRTPFNLVSKRYEEFTIQPAQNTMYIALQFDVYDSTVLTLSEQMFARGKPANYQESAEAVKLWAESKFTIVDDSITLNSQKVDSMNNKIDNATLKLSAEEGVEIWSTNGKGLTIRDSNNEATVSMNTDGTITTKRMVANDAVVNGHIEAVTGKIAGFDINGNNLKGDGVQLDRNQITVGPAIIKPSNLTEGSSVKVQARVTELGDETATTTGNWLFFGGRQLFAGFPNIGYGLEIMNINPSASTGYPRSIGNTSKRFTDIYLETQPNVSSDIRYKSNIQDIDNNLLDAFEGVMPKLFNTQFDNNIHFGYIAQDVERALYKYCLKKYGYEFANEKVKQFAVLSKSESYLSLLYGELTVIKDAYYHREVERLKAQNQALQSELQTIKQFIGMGENNA